MAKVREFARDATLYTGPNEPLGKFMHTLEQTKNAAEAMSDALLKSTAAMVDQAREAHKQMQDINGKLRDGTEKLGLAIDKFNKIAHNADFVEKVKQAQSLVDSLERLAALEASGTLDRVMRAMSK